MSFTLIKNFQNRIYDLLNNNALLRENIDKIYLTVPQDAKYPFLLINIQNVSNQSVFNQAIFEINFEITAFIKDKPQSNLLEIIDLITNTLSLQNFAVEGYLLAGLSPANISFTSSQDLITSKAVIHYIALLKQEIN